jgi:hypothetical protein
MREVNNFWVKHKNNRLVLLLFAILFTNNGFAQESTDLFLVESKKSLFGFTVFPKKPIKITEGMAYDNQPTFINKTQLVFSSEDKSGNFDIIMYNLSNGKFTNMTRTPDVSEFSPDLTSCGQYISAVTVEKDSTQRLWLYPVNFGEPEVLYDDIRPVGYYGWHGEIASLFLLGTINRLVYPYSRDDIFEITENPGRCIKKRPGTDEIAYLIKEVNIMADGMDVFELNTFNVKSRSFKTLGLALGNAVDFCWVDKNNLLMARENSLYLKNINKDTDWEKIATLNISGYKNISRLALSPDKNHLVIAMEASN